MPIIVALALALFVFVARGLIVGGVVWAVSNWALAPLLHWPALGALQSLLVAGAILVIAGLFRSNG